MPIKILDPSLASKIAAGEVIEGPHSVVKELIENSIDANADFISVSIENGGKSKIKITDNGCGMDEEDLRLCLYRYSTSKIKNLADLLNLSTYGFRGEALFSIFAVSRIRITTYTGKGANGWAIEGEGGDFSTLKITPAPPVKGTTVEVRDLFFNTPARLKFLKSQRILKASITKTFETQSLIKPDIKFKLSFDLQTVYDLDKNEGFIDRIAKIIPIKKEDIIEGEEDFSTAKIKIFISKPSISFNSSYYQHIYVNKRAVESKIITTAILKACQKHGIQRYPFYIAIIEIDPSLIDVNVHPQKKEIRFTDEGFIFSSVFITTSNIIEKYIKQTIASITTQRSIDENTKVSEMYLEKEPVKPDVFTEQSFIDMMFEEKSQINISTSYIRFIGQAFSKILIFETEKSILLLDQHAAAERITFEKYIKEYSEKKIQRQVLLTPIDIKLSASATEKIMEAKQWLDEAGFEINLSSPSTISVYSYPSVFNMSEKEIRDLIEYLADVISKPSLLSHELKRDTIASKACKSAIKFNEFISEKKAVELFENLIKCKDPFKCPHGRPTLIEITREEISKKFMRPKEQL